MVRTRTVVMWLVLILYVATIFAQNAHDHHESHDEMHDSHDESHEHWETTEESNDGNIWRALGITTFAGCASFFGAFSIFCIKRKHVAVLPASLAFASGVTIYLSFVNLIPESVEQFHLSTDKQNKTGYMSELLTLFCVFIGIAITFCMESLFHNFGIDPHNHSEPQIIVTNSIATNTNKDLIADFRIVTTVSDSETQVSSDNETQEETETNISTAAVKSVKSKERKPKNYSHISYSVAFALILHHLPEGIATFVSLVHDLQFGVVVAFALALHDIPSGICISVPIYVSSGSKLKPFTLCFVAAITYPIGAFIGWVIIETTSEGLTDFFIATLFGITGGIMLYVSFVELLPNAIIASTKYNSLTGNVRKQPHKNVYAISIVLLFFGFLVMAISTIALNAVGGHSH